MFERNYYYQGVPTINSMLEVATGVGCVYWGAQAKFTEFAALIGDCEVDYFHFLPQTWPPNIGIIRSETEIHVYQDGTSNLNQGISDLAGAMGVLPQLNGQEYNSYFFRIAQGVVDKIKQLYSRFKLKDFEFFFHGHSLGWGVSEICAILMKEIDPAIKAFSFGYSGPRYRTLRQPFIKNNLGYNVFLRGDIVPHLPLENENASLGSLLQSRVLGQNVSWATDSNRFVLTNTGAQLDTFTDWDQLQYNILKPDIISTHVFHFVIVQLLRTFYNLDVNNLGNKCTPILNYIVGLQDPRAQVRLPSPASLNEDEVFELVYFGNDTRIDINNLNVNDIYTVASRETEINQDNPGLNHNILEKGKQMAFSNDFKLTMAINNGKYGRLESHAYHSETANFTDAQNKASQMALHRANMLSATSADTSVKNLTHPVIEFLSIRDAKNPRQGQTFTEWTEGANNAYGAQVDVGGTRSPDNFSTCLSVRIPARNLRDGVTETYGLLTIIAQADNLVQRGVLNTAGPNGVWMEQLTDYINFLCTQTNHMGLMGTKTDEPVKQISSFSRDPVSGVITITVPLHGYATGDKLRLSNTRVPGWSGTYEITNTTTNTFDLAKSIRTNIVLPLKGRVRRVFLAPTDITPAGTKLIEFYQYHIPQGGWPVNFGIKVSKKNPGRQILGASFTRRRVQKA